MNSPDKTYIIIDSKYCANARKSNCFILVRGDNSVVASKSSVPLILSLPFDIFCRFMNFIDGMHLAKFSLYALSMHFR